MRGTVLSVITFADTECCEHFFSAAEPAASTSRASSQHFSFLIKPLLGAVLGSQQQLVPFHLALQT